MKYLPAEAAPDQNQNHQQSIGADSQHRQTQQNCRLGLWIISAGDVPGSVGAVGVVVAVHVERGLDAWKNHCLALKTVHDYDEVLEE